MRQCKYAAFLCLALFIFSYSILFASESGSETQKTGANELISQATKNCIACHEQVTPGIVADWRTSRHSRVVPAEAIKKPLLEKRVSAENIPAELQKHLVGCYECHSLNAGNHSDNFEHMGRRINVVVSPNDCKTCHPVEVQQFSGSKKYYAHKILIENPIYLLSSWITITGIKKMEGTQFVTARPSDATLHETCLGCHGTRVEVKGTKNIATKMGSFAFPNLTKLA